MQIQEMITAVCEVLTQLSGAEVTPTQSISGPLPEGLHFDSLDYCNLVMALETRFGIELDTGLNYGDTAQEIVSSLK